MMVVALFARSFFRHVDQSPDIRMLMVVVVFLMVVNDDRSCC
jgi:hypothetical protein